MTDTDLERRLRQALAARAAAVTAQDLRPAADPARAERRTALGRWWLPLSAGAAAAAVSIAAFVLLGPSDPEPAPVQPGATVSPEPAPPSSPDVSATSSPDGPLPSPSASTIPATAVPTSIPRSALPASPG